MNRETLVKKLEALNAELTEGELDEEALKGKKKEFEDVKDAIQRFDDAAELKAKSEVEEEKTSEVDVKQDAEKDSKELQGHMFTMLGLSGKSAASVPDKAREALEPKSPKLQGKGVRLPDDIARNVLGKAIPTLSDSQGVDNTYQTRITPVQQMEAEPVTLLDRVTKIPAQEGGVKIPKLTQTDANEYGTVAVTWADNSGNGEGGDKGATEIEFQQDTMSTYELNAYTEISETALGRLPTLDTWIQNQFRLAVENAIEGEVVDGGGTYGPEGFISHSSIREVLRDTSSEVNWADIVALKYAIRRNHRSPAVFMASDPALEHLELKTDSTTGQTLFTASMANGIYDRLAGIPFQSSHRLPALGSTGDLTIIDPSQYWLGVEQEVVLARSDHFQFRKNLIAFKISTLVGGKLIQPRAAAKLMDITTTTTTTTGV